MDKRIKMEIKKADDVDGSKMVVLISKTGGRFEVDEDILLRASGYFEGLVNSGMRDARFKELTLELMSDESLIEICEFLSKLLNDNRNNGYQCTKSKSYKMLKEGLKGASYLQICSMIHVYNDLLSKYLSTFPRILKFASKYMLPDVLNNVREYVTENFRKLGMTSSVLKLAPDDICYLLESDFFNAESEFDIFNFVIRWISADESRRQHAEKLLTGVRYGLMTTGEWQRSNEILDELELNINKKEKVVENFRSVGTIFALGSSPFKDVQPQVLSVYDFIKTFEEERKDARSDSVQFRTANRLGPLVPCCRYKVCMVDKCLYLAGGGIVPQRLTDEIHVFDLTDSTWTQCSKMNVPRKNFYFGEMNGHLYAVSGRSFISLTGTVEKYVPREDRWLMSAPLPVETFNLAGCVCNGRMYVSGGLNAHGTSKQVWRYIPDGSEWTEMAPLLNERMDHVMTTLGNRLIVIGGRKCDFDSENVMSGEVYDSEADQWTRLLTLKKPAINSAFLNINDCLYLFGTENFESDNYFFVSSSVETFVQKINLSRWVLRFALNFASDGEVVREYFYICGQHLYIRGQYLYICGQYLYICGQYLYIRGQYLYICGQYLYICGQYFYICGQYLYICGQYLYIRGQYLYICGQYLYICAQHLYICDQF
ncbi:hypothetical protein HELRODRAFT_189564 [Helobdella robusta]|uniref:BACK domain-containing protein n=1 Tax=Helobdella robusta TaxID=6412 RepID=T1FR57_HELRO|nr:hypothetical protein HELRODRAFT_189564 [Helobdella robusta]ESN92674.1 hypothetical protein HELRODRAFT_189564 [Helobdella robusta]